MPEFDYTAKQALELLLAKLSTVSHEMEVHIRDAINAGKDIEVEADEPVAFGRGRKPAKRHYRKNVPFSDEEALTVAMDVLESHLIESRLLVNAAHAEFKQVGLAPPKKDKLIPRAGAPGRGSITIEMEAPPNIEEIIGKADSKKIEIEAEPETVQEKKDLPDLKFEPLQEEQLHSLQALVATLRTLTDFGARHNGNAR
jgi:hypothetical protein